MKLSTIILLVCCMHVSASIYSQTITYTCRNESLQNVFKAIKQQTGYVVFYDQNALDSLGGITIDAKDQPLGNFIKDALTGLPLSYAFEDKTIVVSKKPYVSQLLEQVTKLALAANVTDENGFPIVHASVLLKPVNKAATTDGVGHVTFDDLEPGEYTLEITHISFGKLERKVKLNTSQQFKIVMHTQRHDLGTVNVAAPASNGYQKIERTAATGSYTVITSREIEENPSINIMERLEGKIPGVHFDIANNKIQIRGDNNFFPGGSTPLIVIDGFPAIEQNLANYPGSPLSGAIPYNGRAAFSAPITNSTILSIFNPADIQSITFLKDAAAAAIWGDRAANGVIVIETKKGQRGKTAINLSSTVDVSSMPDMHNLNMMNSRQYIDLEKELWNDNFFNGGDPTTYWRYSNVSPVLTAFYAQQRGELTQAQVDQQLEQLSEVNNLGQLRKYLMQRAVNQQHNLSLSGGTDNTSYYVSGNYSSNTPVFKNNTSKTYSVTANINNEFLNRRLSFSTGINLSYGDRSVNNAATEAMSPGSFGLRPYELLVDANGNPISRYVLFTPHVTDSLTKLGYLPWNYNSFDELHSTSIYKTNNTRLTEQIRGKVTDWLTLEASGMYQKNNYNMINDEPKNSYAVKDMINTGTVIVNGKPVYGVPPGDIVYTNNTVSDDYSVRGQFSIDKRFTMKHHVSMIGGSEIRQSEALGYGDVRYGFDPDSYLSATVNPTTPYKNIYGSTSIIGFTNTSLITTKSRYLSYFGNASYSYDDKYIVSGSLRFDDHNLIGIERRKRAIPLWSGGVRWDMTREHFMENVRAVNNLSLRASLGTGGNIPTGSSPYPLIAISAPDPTSAPQAPATVNAAGNPGLTWETTRTLNFGLDGMFFANRLSVNLDVYKKYSYNILSSQPINSTYGWNSLEYNTADMRSHGIELGLSGDIVRTKDWNWGMSFTYTHNNSRITDTRFPLSAVPESLSTFPVTGAPVDALWLYKWAGLDNQGQTQLYDAQGKIVASTDDSQMKPEDKMNVGHSTPSSYGGLSTNLRYKQFTFTLQASYNLAFKVLKNDVTPDMYPAYGSAPAFMPTSHALANRWRQPGDEAHTNVPGIQYASTTSLQRYIESTANVIDGDNARLQLMALSYSLPNSVLNKLRVMKAVTFRASASNLGLIWKKNKEGIDPDYMFAGSYAGWPPTKNYSFNINVTF